MLCPVLLTTLGKKRALKKYDQFTLNTSCIWTIVPVVQFHEIFVTKIINYLIDLFIISKGFLLIIRYCWSKNFVKLHNSTVIFFVTTTKLWNQNSKTASTGSSIISIKCFAFPLHCSKIFKKILSVPHDLFWPDLRPK